ncbi:MAG: hypothetical protein ACOC80_12365 [Petrotogales bacterium]
MGVKSINYIKIEYIHNLDKDVTLRCIQLFGNTEVCPIVFNVLENAKKYFLEDIYDFMIPEEEVL